MLFKIDCQENQGKSELGLINIIRIENHFEVLHFLNFMHKIWLLNQGLTSEHVRTQKKINFFLFLQQLQTNELPVLNKMQHVTILPNGSSPVRKAEFDFCNLFDDTNA